MKNCKTLLLFQIALISPTSDFPFLVQSLQMLFQFSQYPDSQCPPWSPGMYTASSHPGFRMHLHLSNSYLPDMVTAPRSGPQFIYTGCTPGNVSRLLMKWVNQLFPRWKTARNYKTVHSKACSSQITWILIMPGLASSDYQNPPG